MEVHRNPADEDVPDAFFVEGSEELDVKHAILTR
jgi:hypothetical protein